jgi:hypothetical protein
LFFLFSLLRHNDSTQILLSAAVPVELNAGANSAEH